MSRSNGQKRIRSGSAGRERLVKPICKPEPTARKQGQQFCGYRRSNAVRVGDKLIQVDSVLLSSATRGAIFALHGQPGSVRMLVLERDGQQLTLPAKVTAF